MKLAYHYKRVAGTPVGGSHVQGGFQPTFGRQGSTATSVNALGVMVNNATGVPRWDHDRLTPFAPRGLLAEKAITNLCLRSEAFENATWVKNQTTVNANTQVAPDNLTTAETVVETATTNVHNVSQAFSALTASTIYNFSVFLKRGTRQWAAITVLRKDNTSVTQYFDILNGVLGSGGLLNATISAWNNGWYRCSVSVNVLTGATNVQFRVGLASADGVTSYLGAITENMHVWGAQLELTNKTSYVPTGSGTVNRGADTWSVDVAALATRLTRGRMAIACIVTEDAGVLATLGDGTANNRIRLLRETNGNISMVVTSGGVQQVNLDLGNVVNNTLVFASARWAPGRFTGVLNANAPVTTLTGTVPSGLNILRAGRSHTAGEELNGWVQNLTLEPDFRLRRTFRPQAWENQLGAR